MEYQEVKRWYEELIRIEGKGLLNTSISEWESSKYVGILQITCDAEERQNQGLLLK